MSNQKTMIQVDRALLPALASALRLASGRALCDNNPKLREAMKVLNDQVTSLVNPYVFLHFSDNSWSELMLHLKPGSTWSIHAERRSLWSDSDARIVVQTGRFRIQSKMLLGVDIKMIDINHTVATLADEIEVVAPMDCRRIAGTITEKFYPWQNGQKF